MQKIEIMLYGPEEKQCAELIGSLIKGTIKHFDVCQVMGYCGPAPAKRGYGELLVPDFMRCRQVKPAHRGG